MLNRKDLLGGVMLGTVLSCVLFVGGMTTSANASLAGSGDAVTSEDGARQVNAAPVRANNRPASRN